MNLLHEYILLSSQDNRLKDRRYITEVLGIQIPLHESYPFSTGLEAQILHEHMLLEGFFDGLKKLKDDALLFGRSLKEIITDPKRIGAFVGALHKNVIKRTIKPVKSFFKMLMEKLPDYIKDKFPTFIKIAEKILAGIDKVIDTVLGMSGWKQAIGAMVLALGIKFIWKEIGELIERGKEYLNDLIPMFDVIDAAGLNEDEESSGKLEKAKEAVKKFVEWFKEQIIGQVTEFIEKKLKELATSVVGTAISGGVSQIWEKLTKLYGGAKFVMGTLAPAFGRFMRKGPTITTSESLLRNYVRSLLLEQTESGSLVVVDIQPEYESATPFDIGDMLRSAVENYSRVLFLYNGEDTLGMISESGLKNFYFEKLDYDEEAIEELLSKSEFFDKGYGFFRDVMDSDICFPRQDIIKIVKYMIDNDVVDIRDLSEEDVDSIAVDDLLFDDLEDYGFNIPDLEEVLPRWSGSDIAGGARNECLAEVEILASAQGLSFNQVDRFIYEGDNRYTESLMQEKKRVPRKKGQHRNSSKHSDLFTDENPKGTIKGLKFATVKDAEASVNKIKRSGKSHAHKTQAAIAMEQRAKSMGKKSAAAVYRKFINQQKEKTANK